MFTVMKRVSLVLAAITLLAFVGCSKAPEAEMQAANAGMDHARAAEAEMYAPEAWQTAQDTLNAALAKKKEQDEKFSLFRSYTDSKSLFMRAEALSQEAATKAEAGKEAVKNEVMGMMTMADSALATAAAALKKAPVGKGNKADIELIRSDLDGVSTMFTDAKNDFDAGKYMASKTKVQQVIDRANSITEEIKNAAMMKAGKK